MLSSTFLRVSCLVLFVLSCNGRKRLSMSNEDFSQVDSYPSSLPLYSLKVRDVVDCIVMCLESEHCSVVFMNRISLFCNMYGTSRMSVRLLNMNFGEGWHFYHRNQRLCPISSGYVYNIGVDRCIKADTDRTYDGGVLQCQIDGASLVKVDSPEMWQFVKSVFNAKNIVNGYIQGTKDMNGIWRYDDGKPFTFMNWGTKEPDNGPKDFHIVMWRGDGYQFHDVMGNMQYGFACEIDLMS